MISPSDGGPDVFVHRSATKKTLVRGDQVYFKVEVDQVKDKMKAVESRTTAEEHGRSRSGGGGGGSGRGENQDPGPSNARLKQADRLWQKLGTWMETATQGEIEKWESRVEDAFDRNRKEVEQRGFVEPDGDPSEAQWTWAAFLAAEEMAAVNRATLEEMGFFEGEEEPDVQELRGIQAQWDGWASWE